MKVEGKEHAVRYLLLQTLDSYSYSTLPNYLLDYLRTGVFALQGEPCHLISSNWLP